MLSRDKPGKILHSKAALPCAILDGLLKKYNLRPWRFLEELKG